MQVSPLSAFAGNRYHPTASGLSCAPNNEFPHINDDRQILVVGTQYELGKESYLVAVFAFGFHLVEECGAQVLQPLAVLPAAQKHLVHHDKKFPCPVGIELAAEILVGVESHVVLEQGFQKVQKRAFCPCCVPQIPIAGWAASVWVAGRAVVDSPSPTRIAPPKICSTNERIEVKSPSIGLWSIGS